MKKCTKCGKLKELDEFHKRKDSKDGLRAHCRECVRENKEEWHKNNPEYTKEYNKKYSETHSERRKEYMKKYYKENKKRMNELSRLYYEQNNEKMNELSRLYYEQNGEQILEQKKEYYIKNNEQILEQRKKYAKSNRKKINEYTKSRRKCPLIKLRHIISNAILNSLKHRGFKKSSRTATILGCTFEEFKLHIEKQFSQSMTWDNQGLWHLDHIYPVSRAVDEQHLLQLNHYTNFQPLWAEDNLKKGNKLPEEYKNDNSN